VTDARAAVLAMPPPPTSPADLCLRAAEAVAMARAPAAPRWSPTFVVGAPRSGTTLVALHAFNAFELAYVPNVSNVHRKTPLVLARRALKRGKWRGGYDNRYGESQGDLGPSDGWSVLNRWFDRYGEATAAEAARAKDLVRLVAGLEQSFDAPFLNKNNANSARVRALAKLFPDALFVHVRRELADAAASLLEARERHEVALGQWWSAAPPQYRARTFGSAIEQVAATLVGIDRYVEGALSEVAAGRTLVLEYERFCERPSELTQWLEREHARRGLALRRRSGPLPERFEASRIPPKRREELERELEPALRSLGALAKAR
jgi:hypothetical protein